MSSGDDKNLKNFDDLSKNPMSHLSPKKQQEIVEKFAEESARLEIKRKEAEIDIDISERKIKSAQEQAQESSRNRFVDSYRIETEHKSKDGYTRATFQRGCFGTILLFLSLSSAAFFSLLALIIM